MDEIIRCRAFFLCILFCVFFCSFFYSLFSFVDPVSFVSYLVFEAFSFIFAKKPFFFCTVSSGPRTPFTSMI